MGLFSSQTALADIVAGHTELEARPELWAPAHLADYYDRVADTRDTITPLSHPNWLAAMTEGAPAGLTGRPGPGALHRHLRVALAHIHHSGVEPGSVRPPTIVRRYADEPARLIGGRDSSIISQLKATSLTDADIAERERYEWSEQNREAFDELVERTEKDVLSDHNRAWDAYVHLVLIDLAEHELEREKAEKERTQRERALLECPVCGQMNGSIESREVEPGEAPSRYAKGLRIRSCKPCWHEARRQQQERRAVEQLDDGSSRADRIRAWLP